MLWMGGSKNVSVYNLVGCFQDEKKSLPVLTTIFKVVASLNFQDGDSKTLITGAQEL